MHKAKRSQKGTFCIRDNCLLLTSHFFSGDGHTGIVRAMIDLDGQVVDIIKVAQQFLVMLGLSRIVGNY